MHCGKDIYNCANGRIIRLLCGKIILLLHSKFKNQDDHAQENPKYLQSPQEKFGQYLFRPRHQGVEIRAKENKHPQRVGLCR